MALSPSEPEELASRWKPKQKELGFQSASISTFAMADLHIEELLPFACINVACLLAIFVVPKGLNVILLWPCGYVSDLALLGWLSCFQSSAFSL